MRRQIDTDPDLHPDAGMTLVELLVSVVVVALIATVLAAAITVVFRQAPETTARADTARWEQNLGTWLPADLTSAEWPDPSDPTQAVGYAPYEPCPSVACTFGDNIAHLSWNDDGTTVHVSYRYGATADGTYEFRRVECRAGSCTSITLVRDMPAPAAGGTPPISVTFPPDVLETDPNGSEIVNSSGRRVTVTVYGAGGTDLLTFSGGGVERVDLEPAAIQPPEFLQARSGCGGPITLIVDESGSLSNTDASRVKAGVESFVETFAGTPTMLQIVGFSNRARVLDDNPNSSPHPWNYWFDLSEQSVVDDLLGSGSPIDDLDNNGATNWEDALYRAFYTEGGQTYEAVSNPATPPAELVVFFTDGLPTHDRDTNGQTGAENPEAPSVHGHFDYDNTTVSGGTQFSPRGWYRASWLLQQTSTRVIGVGVGNQIDDWVNLDRDTTIPDSVIASSWSAPYRSGTGYSHARSFLAEVPLGDLIAGNDISNFSGNASERYLKVEYDGGWDPEAVKDADILTTTDFSRFGGALESIALAECGGTLTVQTRKLSDGTPLRSAVTYEVSGTDRPLTESTTSAVSKTAVFDISTEGGTTAEVLLQPRTLDGTGYTAHDWICRSRNVEITDPAKLSEADPGAGAIGGVNITVAANEAVSCILLVVPE